MLLVIFSTIQMFSCFFVANIVVDVSPQELILELFGSNGGGDIFTSPRFQVGGICLRGRRRHTGAAQAAVLGWRQVENTVDAPATCDNDNTWHCRRSIGSFGETIREGSIDPCDNYNTCSKIIQYQKAPRGLTINNFPCRGRGGTLTSAMGEQSRRPLPNVDSWRCTIVHYSTL